MAEGAGGILQHASNLAKVRGCDIASSTPEAVQKWTEGELIRWTEVVRDNQIRLFETKRCYSPFGVILPSALFSPSALFPLL
jgi:hypothetical protein